MKGNYTILKILPDDLSISYLQKLKVISTWFVDLIPISTSIPIPLGKKAIFFFLAACPNSSILLVEVTLKSHISNLLSCHFLSEHLQGSPAKWWQQPRFPIDFPQVNPNLGISMKTHSCSSMILPAKCPFGSMISDCHFRLADGIDCLIVDH